MKRERRAHPSEGPPQPLHSAPSPLPRRRRNGPRSRPRPGQRPAALEAAAFDEAGDAPRARGVAPGAHAGGVEVSVLDGAEALNLLLGEDELQVLESLGPPQGKLGWEGCGQRGDGV